MDFMETQMELSKMVKKRQRKRKKIMRISNQHPYYINLNSIDIEFIISNISKMATDSVREVSRNRKKDYCEFEIVTDTDGELEADELKKQSNVHEAVDYYLCNTCNIRVPITYHQVHQNSYKHKTLNELTNSVLKRVCQNININIHNLNETNHQDVYYCEPCSKVILKSNKNGHQLSQEHLDMLRYDQLMNVLLNMYLTNDATKYDSEYFLNLNNYAVQLNNNHDDRMKKYNSNVEVSLNDKEIRSGEKDVEFALRNIDNFDTKIIDLKTSVLGILENDNERVDSHDDNSPRILNANYNDVMNSININPNSYDASDIVNTNNSDNKMMQSKNDDSEMMNANHEAKEKTNYSEFKRNLALCRDAEEKQFCTNLITSNEDAENFQKYICKMICKSSHSFPIPTIINSAIILTNSKEDHILVSVNNYHGIMSKENGVIVCCLCQKHIPDIKSHIESDEHMLSDMEMPMDDCFIRQITSKRKYCTICNMLFSRKTETHANRIWKHNRYLNICRANSKTRGEISRCDVCCAFIPIDNLFTHYNSETHKSNIRSKSGKRC